MRASVQNEGAAVACVVDSVTPGLLRCTKDDGVGCCWLSVGTPLQTGKGKRGTSNGTIQ